MYNFYDDDDKFNGARKQRVVHGTALGTQNENKINRLKKSVNTILFT